MDNKRLDQIILQVENYLECWKQFNHYLNLARARKFENEDETQFLELKSVLTQELEMILATVDFGSPTKEEIHTLLSGTASLRAASELSDASVRTLENNWHKIFIALQSNLGQLKVKQRDLDSQSVWKRLFGKKS